MAKEFKPSTWQQPVQDIVKEYEAFDEAENAPEDRPTKPEEFSKAMVRRGTLCPETGVSTGNSKQGTILAGNIRGYSKKGQENYRRIFGHD